jgi:hypothetical protein
MEVLIGKSSINEGILWYLIAIPAHIWDWNPTMSLFLCEFGNSYYFRAKGPAPQKHVQDAISAGCRRSFEMALPACGWVRWPHPTMVLPTPMFETTSAFDGQKSHPFFFQVSFTKKNPDGLVMFSKSKFAEIKTMHHYSISSTYIYIYTYIYTDPENPHFFNFRGKSSQGLC